ncbi:unnamed protein product [Cylicocyclus nassatus]|uniref:Uncharacterized protein n=1 Tax=Cylicocyclus nassatus TaxID=53992 RepID=A0AA36GXL4_CYLNA|nr:unnamed protein product [Cylicocyclus nassatus]
MSSSTDLAATMRSILDGDHQLSAELSTALVSLGSAVNQLRIQQDATVKELELVRRMCRTSWLLVINLPLPFGQSKSQSLQLLFEKIGYSKPLFDAERDLIAADILYVNKNGSCNMAFFVPQRHHDYLMSADFQRKIVAYNQKIARESWVTVGRVLTPKERQDYEMACSLKRLIIAQMMEKRRADPKYNVQFILVDKRTLRLRIDKQYFTLEEASAKFSIPVEAITEEKNKRITDLHKGNKKRQASSMEGPSSKISKH